MKIMKVFLLTLAIPLLAFTGFHKYYVSVTEVDYVPNQESVQITTRIFADDFEKALRERFNKDIVLTQKDEAKEVDHYIDVYLKEKIKVEINGENTELDYLGKEYDGFDIVQCYIEIKNVKKIEAIKITNRVLFSLFDEQQNMIKTKINSKQKSFLLNKDNREALLKFN